MNQSALDRFLRYAQIDTQSKEDSDTYPSTQEATCSPESSPE